MRCGCGCEGVGVWGVGVGGVWVEWDLNCEGFN